METNTNDLIVDNLIIYFLKLEGVKYIFGVPGGGLVNILNTLKNSTGDFTYIICRHETGASYMADGYYRATGNLGVVMVTTGPGATNALTGIMNAQADGSAVLLITGEIDQQFYGKGYLQEGIDASLDIKAIYTAATGYSSIITSGLDAATIFKQALRDALGIPRQAVHLSLPVNVSLEPVSNTSLPTATSVYRTSPKGAPLEDVKTAMAAFLAAKRPLLLLGNGCRQALSDATTYKSLLQFVETYGIPVITTADGKGIFSELHDLSFRVYGIADCMWPYYYFTDKERRYDGLMVIGSSLGELSTNSWSQILVPQVENAPFIQVDINQKIIARSFEVTQGVVGEAGAFINDLASLIPQFPPDEEAVTLRKQAIAKIKNTYSPFVDPGFDYNSNASPIKPAALMRVLQSGLPPDSKIFIDAGNCVGWSVHFLTIEPPASIFTALSMGPMGFGVGAVVGAKIGCPGITCVGIVGDGAMLMFGAEVSTAAHYKAGAIWIVLNDNNLSMVSQGMEHFYPDKTNPGVWTELYELGNPDIAGFASSLGAEAYTVNSPQDLENVLPTVLNRANNDGVPQVIIANIDRTAIPPYYNTEYIVTASSQNN